ncbi:MAG: hypothetical protein WAM60_04985 [Candidatus Promineifilaceae bacterium]
MSDLALVHRLSEQGIFLHAEAALTSSPHPLRSALINMLVGGQYGTYVWKSKDRGSAAFVQIRCEPDCPSAQIVFIGTGQIEPEKDGNEIDEDIWLSLLDDLVAEVGRRGTHNLVAEVSETGPELPVLRRSGFAVYTRQDIWVCDQYNNTNDQADILTSRQPVDDWDIQLLYANNVPRLIQLVEPNLPIEDGQSWILREDGELAALIHFHEGPVATWLRVLIHPNANTQAEEIISASLAIKPPSANHPVYCCVRRYQSWLQSGLDQAGFRHWGSQAVMVRHIAQPVVSDAVPAGVLEAQTIPGSSTLVQGFSHPGGNGHQKI